MTIHGRNRIDTLAPASLSKSYLNWGGACHEARRTGVLLIEWIAPWRLQDIGYALQLHFDKVSFNPCKIHVSDFVIEASASPGLSPAAPPPPSAATTVTTAPAHQHCCSPRP